MSDEKLYAQRDHRALEPHFSRHVSAIVSERLFTKHGLAAELAWRDREIERLRAALYTQPPRDEWREAVHDELVTTWTLSADNKDDMRKALDDIIDWHVRVALDPAISSDAQALIERGKAMRSGWRPASEPPDTTRSVLVWLRFGDVETFGKTLGGPSGFAFQNGAITHWRDVKPPTEG